MDEHISCGVKSAYTRYLLKWKLATDSFGLQPKQIKASVDHSAIVQILNDQHSSCVSTFAMNGPGFSPPSGVWFKPKPWVNDSCFSKIVSEFRACNSGPTKNGLFFKFCLLCSDVNIRAINNEVKNRYIYLHNIFK